ncbi:MAG: ribulose-phosphate 3-epimerase, partial [Dehalococcoidia bacterium]|nr:ribulose-phosphate 3-epimerase [Dehalococcoidia bacterium]
ESLTHMLCQAELFTDWVQIDIMDGIFVPSRSISARDIVAAETDLSWEAHLMVQDPKKCIEDFYAVGAKRIIVHYEAVKEEAQDVIKHIISFGMTAGIALNPETPTSVLDDKLLSNLDSVLVMAVQPGYYGAKFIPEVLDKITSFRKLYPDMNVGIDGGVKAANIAEIARSGANEICVGSAIFAQLDIASAYNELVKVAKQGWGL